MTLMNPKIKKQFKENQSGETDIFKQQLEILKMILYKKEDKYTLKNLKDKQSEDSMRLTESQCLEIDSWEQKVKLTEHCRTRRIKSNI